VSNNKSSKKNNNKIYSLKFFSFQINILQKKVKREVSKKKKIEIPSKPTKKSILIESILIPNKLVKN